MKTKNNNQYSRFTDKGPNIAERVLRTIRNLIKKPVFQKRNADWLCELTFISRQNNNTKHNSTGMKPIDASKKIDEKIRYSNLQYRRVRQQPKSKLGQIVRTADIKRVFEKSDSTNFSYQIYTITEVIHDTIPSYRINYLLKRYNQNLLLPTKLSLEEKSQVMKKLNLIQ